MANASLPAVGDGPQRWRGMPAVADKCCSFSLRVHSKTAHSSPPMAGKFSLAVPTGPASSLMPPRVRKHAESPDTERLSVGLTFPRTDAGLSPAASIRPPWCGTLPPARESTHSKDIRVKFRLWHFLLTAGKSPLVTT